MKGCMSASGSLGHGADIRAKGLAGGFLSIAQSCERARQKSMCLFLRDSGQRWGQGAQRGRGRTGRGGGGKTD